MSNWVKIWNDYQKGLALVRQAPGHVDTSTVTNGEFNRRGGDEGILGILANKGFTHVIECDSHSDIETLIASGRAFQPWTKFKKWCVFSDETDAVAFKLMVNP